MAHVTQPRKSGCFKVYLELDKFLWFQEHAKTRGLTLPQFARMCMFSFVSKHSKEK